MKDIKNDKKIKYIGRVHDTIVLESVYNKF